MNPKHIVIIGAGIIGAGALLFMSQPPTYQPGGFAGGVSKKEEALIGPVTETETVTETQTPMTLEEPIYNIFFPDPSFPTIPEAPISEPWWVTSLEEPSTTTKKETSTYWDRKKALSPGVRAGIKRIVEGPPTPTHTPVGGIGQSATEAKPIKKETVPGGIGFFISQLYGGK
ncbi:hypothetical protein ES702_07147 [subsurface metagenome]